MADVRADLTLRTPAGRAVDLRVHARAGTRLADVQTQLLSTCGVVSDAPLWTSRAPLPSSASLGDDGLRDGCELFVGPPTERSPTVTNGLHLRVVGGPDAGRTMGLRTGTVRIGRGSDCDLQLADPDVSRHHLDLSASSSGGVRARDAGSRNGTVLEGAALRTGEPVAPGQILRVGDSLVTVGGVQDPPALLRRGDDGSVRVVTASTPVPAPQPVETTVPGDDPAPARHRVPWLAAALPLVTGVLFAVVMHSPQFLLFALLTPVTMLGTALGERLSGRRRQRQHRHDRRQQAAEMAAAIDRQLTTETVLRRRRDPDPAELVTIAELPTARVWERAFNGAELLRVRVGSAQLPSSATVRRGAHSASAGMLWCVPVVVDLADGPLGVTGPLPVARALARWVAAQLVTLGPPGGLQLAAVLGDGDEHWRWLRWLPHLRYAVGATAATRQALVRELDCLITAREAEREPTSAPRVVVVVDLDGQESSALIPVLARGATVGVTSVWVGSSGTGVPPICTQTVHISGETGSLITVARPGSAATATDSVSAIADQVSVEWADRVARALAPLRDEPDGATATRYATLIGAPGMELDRIADRWSTADGQLVTVLGANSAGPVWIDLARDGPHALVAGTTGSGKSELLRTLVAGLSLRYPPELLSFLLIDYKGGAAFAECARLPHVHGVVTDLDAHLTSRALLSLECELRRRERLFAAVAADDLDAYRARATDAVPRLVIVVDEFATLAAELPEFVRGLVAVAQRGRSLGVHLVLATQRPGSCVSPDIRANTALRIALRVADQAESFDLIGRPDAARIAKDRPGRAVVCCGDRIDEVQVSHLGRRTMPDAGGPTVELLDRWRQVAGGQPAEEPTGPTDLARVVAAVTAAAEHLGVAGTQAPWLPPLENSISLRSIPADPVPARVAFGVADRPDVQGQFPELIDLAAGDAILIAGAARSGRSTALRTIAVASAHGLPPQELHVYVIDCAGGALRDLTELPHCVTATTPADWDVVAELVRRLELSVLPRRQRAAADTTRTGQGDGADDRPALQLVLIDGWDEFVSASSEHDLGRTADAAARLIAAAGSAATTVVLTGGRAALASRLTSTIPAKYALRLADRADYALAGISPRDVPACMPPGRALRAPDGVEVQIAAPAELSPLAQPARHPAEGLSLRPLPALLRAAELPASTSLIRIGLTGAAGAVAGLPIDAVGGLLVTGPSASGRSTALRLVLREAVRLGLPTVLAAPPGSALRRDAEALDVEVLDPRCADAVARIATSRVILLDDADTLANTCLDEAACAVLATAPGAHLVVGSAAKHNIGRMFSGVVPVLLRNRRIVLLSPEASDGDLLGTRLPAGPASARIPGRGVLVGDFITSDRCSTEGRRSAGDGWSWVQVAQPGGAGEPDVGQAADQPMCGYR